jgi:hypothetical protein
MSSKRPPVDLLAMTSEHAIPLPEATQRIAPQPSESQAVKPPPTARKGKGTPPREHVATANLEALAFKVPPSFRKRFRSRAAEADIKLNELLFAAFDAWEAQQGFKK